MGVQLRSTLLCYPTAAAGRCRSPSHPSHKRPPFVPPQQDAGTAKKLAFAREVSTRCITLEGDDFNPGGTLTGGSRNKGNSVLVRREAGFGRVQS